jgi:hypothetical protein
MKTKNHFFALIILELFFFISCSTNKPLIDMGSEQEYDSTVYPSLDKFPKKQLKAIKLESDGEVIFEDSDVGALLTYKDKSWAIKKVKNQEINSLILGIEEFKSGQQGYIAPLIVFRKIVKNAPEILIKPEIKVELVSDSLWSGITQKITYKYDFAAIKGKAGDLFLMSLAQDPPVVITVIKNTKCTVMITPTIYDVRACDAPVKSSPLTEVKVLKLL